MHELRLDQRLQLENLSLLTLMGHLHSASGPWRNFSFVYEMRITAPLVLLQEILYTFL